MWLYIFYRYNLDDITCNVFTSKVWSSCTQLFDDFYWMPIYSNVYYYVSFRSNNQCLQFPNSRNWGICCLGKIVSPWWLDTVLSLCCQICISFIPQIFNNIHSKARWSESVCQMSKVNYTVMKPTNRNDTLSSWWMQVKTSADNARQACHFKLYNN